MTKEEKKEYDKQYYRSNKEKRAKLNKTYYEENKEIRALSNKLYYDENREKLTIYKREYKKNKLKTNPAFKLQHNIRRLISQSFQTSGIKKDTKTNKILGLSIIDFKSYIEKQFEPWMNWNNYGRYSRENERTWQIDHKIPISLAKAQEEIIKLNHYTNLRPLCSKENLDKRDRLI